MLMHSFFRFLDPALIWFYRISGHAYVDFLAGTLVLAFLTLVIGEFTISLAFLAIRKQIDEVNREALRYQGLTMDALKAGDKKSYKAANQMANDAFGKVFFLQIALSAARLWPVPLALAWMQYRFQEIEIPLVVIPYSLGFIGIFFLLYGLAYFLFKRVKYRLPYFRRIKSILDRYDLQGGTSQALAGQHPVGVKHDG